MMGGTIQLLTTLKGLAWDYLRTAYQMGSSAGKCADVERYCFFIACPRSGHSIVGALLDAHPEMIIAHECGAFRYQRARFKKYQILQLLLENSEKVAKTGRKHFVYSLDVPGAWQGRASTLRVIGDKHGEGALLRIQEMPSLLPAMCQTFSPIRFVHVVRNPYDSIASIALSRTRGLSLDDAIRYYFSLCQTIVHVRERISRDQCFELRHEHLISDPDGTLSGLCAFLGVEAPRDYLAACRKALFKKPLLTRREITWSLDQIHAVAWQAENLPFLDGYRHEA